MRNIVIRVDDDQFEWIKERSERLGFSPSGYAKYQILEEYDGKETTQYTITELTDMASSRLDAIKKAEGSFIISGLFDPIVWRTITRSQKRMLAIWLKRKVESDSELEKIGETTSSVSIYGKKPPQEDEKDKEG